jgi:hypothetical protein
MRREFLDHLLFGNARDLERKLGEFQTNYNQARGHAALEGHTPLTFITEHTVVLRGVSHCRELVQFSVAA